MGAFLWARYPCSLRCEAAVRRWRAKDMTHGLRTAHCSKDPSHVRTEKRDAARMYSISKQAVPRETEIPCVHYSEHGDYVFPSGKTVCLYIHSSKVHGSPQRARSKDQNAHVPNEARNRTGERHWERRNGLMPRLLKTSPPGTQPNRNRIGNYRFVQDAPASALFLVLTTPV